VKENVPISELRIDEVEPFRDVEVAFSEAKYHLESKSVGDEEPKDRASKENLPRRSGRKETQTIGEEQTNKDIILGS